VQQTIVVFATAFIRADDRRALAGAPRRTSRHYFGLVAWWNIAEKGLPMPDGESTTIALRQPTQCVLWEHPERTSGDELLEEVETYEDSSHSMRVLYKCRECGQLYFFEWWEWVDWEDGNDTQYSTLFPVGSVEESEALKKTDSFNLMRYYPRLYMGGASSAWVGKG
jgi:hypothetical protein